MTRLHKDSNWRIPADNLSWEHINLSVLMDLRDQAMETNRLLRELAALARCHRIPKALDAMAELGLEARRRTRLRRKRRKAP